MAVEANVLNNDELDEIVGGGNTISVPMESQASKFVRKLKSEGLTKEQALEKYKDNLTRYTWIRLFFR